ncbi:MAG: c-type cytochrome [Terrimicrobiaceae bacterium]
MMRPTLLLLCLLALGGCDWMPGKPKPESQWQPASAIKDFSTLVAQNCRGCHGSGNEVAGSIAIDNPTYLSVVPREVLQNVIANGIPGTAMPGFAVSAGGTLTDAQIEILVNGMLALKPTASSGALPPYAAGLGDPSRGAAVFSASCASCHGAAGTGTEKAGSVVNAAYLDLASNQYLRTIVIAGRPELGCPDFANRTPGKPLTNEDIADVTAWLVSHRKNEFGQPVAPANSTKP